MTQLGLWAMLMLAAGHILRAVRQVTLFPPQARPGNLHVMVGLGIGHLINAILPFRVGEIARAFYVARRTDLGFGLVCASVIAERVSDLIFVALLLAVIAFYTGYAALLPSAMVMAASAAGILLTSALLVRSQRLRALLWSATSIFNDRLRVALIDMFWTAAQLMTSPALLRPRYLALTSLMWCAYLAAYGLLGLAIGIDVYAIIATLLGAPLNALLTSGLLSGPIVLIASLATLMILGAGLIADGVGVRSVLRRVLHLGQPRREVPLLAFSGASFQRPEDYGAILDAHFTRRKPAMASFGLHGLEGAVVRHMLPGGSDAVTAVVDINGRLAIRKFAAGQAGQKLAEQVSWLQRYQTALPLAPVQLERASVAKCHYDMPYIASARDLYEMAHVLPIADSRRLLRDVVDRVAAWHGDTAGADCPDAVLALYVDRKIVSNVETMLDFVQRQIPQHYRINGASFTLDAWRCMLDRHWIAAHIRNRKTSAIHGDLTIENIVVCPDQAPGWYLIDPNPGNLFDTPLIDWAKLMQSLNLGYETLNRGPVARVGGGEIDLMLSRSRVYAELHDALRAQLSELLSTDEMREVAFHEIVNYLRLIPYKIRHDPARAMTFFAGASILLGRYLEGRDD